jgi:hypothetical protein
MGNEKQTFKHAVLVAAFGNFDLLELLLKQLDDEDIDIYLHINQKSNFDRYDDLKKCVHKSSLFFLPRQSLAWGNDALVFSVWKPFLEMANPHHYAYYHYFSGTDLLLVSSHTFKEFFSHVSGKQFLTSIPCNKFRIRQKYSRRQIFMKALAKRPSKTAQRFIAIFRFSWYLAQACVGYDRVKKYFPNKKLYVGNAFFSISDSFVTFLNQNWNLWEKMYKGTLVPEESFLQTALAMSPMADSIFVDPDGKQNNLLLEEQFYLTDGAVGDGWMSMNDDWAHILENPRGRLRGRKFSLSKDSEIVYKTIALAKTR